MNAPHPSWEIDLLNSYRQHYEGMGLKFIVEPKTEELPYFLKDYRPDAIAISDHGGVVLGVKQMGESVTGSQQLRQLAEEVAKHKGWRLDLLLADRNLTDHGYLIPSREEVKLEVQKLREDSNLLQVGTSSIGTAAVHLLFGWSLFEAASRRVLVDAGVKLSRNVMNPKELIELLVTQDFISDTEGETAVRLMRQRNLVAHGFLKQPIAVDETTSLFNLIEKLLSERNTIS